MAKGKQSSKGHAVDFDNVPDDNTYPRGSYHAKLKAWEPGEYEEKFTVNLEYELLKPKAFKGAPFFTRFFLGTDDDPEAKQPETQRRSRDFIKLKKVLASLGVKLKGTIEDICESGVGEEEILQIGKGKPRADGSVFNNIVKAFAVGERDPEITEEEEEGSASGGKKKPLKA